MRVLLISTGRLPASYFVRARAELGHPETIVDVLAWAPPREPVGELVQRYLLLGPGEMPQSQPDQQGPPGRQAGQPPTSTTPQRSWNLRRVRAGLRRRLRPVFRARWSRALRRLLRRGPSRKFWRTVRTNQAASQLAREADLLVVLDAGGIRTGWHLARRHAGKPALLGLSAAAQFARSDHPAAIR